MAAAARAKAARRAQAEREAIARAAAQRAEAQAEKARREEEANRKQCPFQYMGAGLCLGDGSNFILVGSFKSKAHCRSHCWKAKWCQGFQIKSSLPGRKKKCSLRSDQATWRSQGMEGGGNVIKWGGSVRYNGYRWTTYCDAKCQSTQKWANTLIKVRPYRSWQCWQKKKQCWVTTTTTKKETEEGEEEEEEEEEEESQSW
eukprot:TRINITY_DN6532_c0_g1_i5.p1 TRINITY_DN6532_c0_g1~~TRINITY_DN6532_c0_g1_i5.p1  ORF type:complete len:201 (+),score=43.97 TRINITY_DN6532_c0_g1_i5:444-1046(+)